MAGRGDGVSIGAVVITINAVDHFSPLLWRLLQVAELNCFLVGELVAPTGRSLIDEGLT